MLQFVEGQRIVNGQRTNDAQAKSLVNQAIDIMRAVGRAAMDAAQPFFLSLSLFWLAS
jgi:hypothetical protein